MVLNDVWRTIGKEVGFYYEVNFDDVPSAPGVYAWFYPLRILSRSRESLEQLVAQVQALLNYDSGCNGPPAQEALLSVAWWGWAVSASRRPKTLHLSEHLIRAWEEIVSDNDVFWNFQQSLLKASIFMPPLYVGKADNLNVRCGQHLAGVAGSNDFHRRFEEFARQIELPLRSVRKLIFACVRTGASMSEEEQSSPVHELIEGIMKSICAPPYGMR